MKPSWIVSAVVLGGGSGGSGPGGGERSSGVVVYLSWLDDEELLAWVDMLPRFAMVRMIWNPVIL